MTAPANQGSGAFGYGLLGLLVFVFVAASFCSKQKSQTGVSAAAENYEQAAENMGAATDATEPLPLDASAVQRGTAQLKLVASLDLPGSRQIFSRNCYDALAMKFDWHQLDRCGGFDALAVRSVEQGVATSGDELEYFQSEAAATRFLTAATTNGLAGGDADIRWANLEASTRKLALPRQTVAANVASGATVEAAVDSETDIEDDDAPDDPLAPASGSSL